jgi:hypothetical protein
MKRSREVRIALRIAVLVLALVLTQLGQVRISAQLSVPPPTGMVSWWPGDGNANDIVGSNNGTLVNGATFAPGKVGQAFLLDGVAAWVDLGSSNVFNFGSADFTIDFWILWNSLAGEQVMIEKFDNGPAFGGVLGGWTFTKVSTNQFQFGGAAGGGYASVNVTPPGISTGTWHHVTVTRSAGLVDIYWDSALIGTGLVANIDPTPQSLKLGRRGDARGFFHNGLIDEVETFNRALSPIEIVAIYSAGSAGKQKPSTAGTVSLGGFIDSAGNIVNGSVLLLQNGPVPGGKATFGGNVQFKSGDPSPTGNVRYIDHVTGDDIKATSFTRLVIEAGPCGLDTHAMIMGKATVNSVPDQNLRIDVDDCDKPGSLLPGTPDMLVIMTGPTRAYTNGGPLVRGDIVVEKAQ